MLRQQSGPAFAARRAVFFQTSGFYLAYDTMWTINFDSFPWVKQDGHQCARAFACVLGGELIELSPIVAVNDIRGLINQRVRLHS